jgi:hypothetical protein
MADIISATVPGFQVQDNVIYATKEIRVGRAGTGSDLSPYPRDRVQYACDNYTRDFMEVPILPDHDEVLSEVAHANSDPMAALGHTRTVRYEASTELVWNSFELTPMCLRAILEGRFTGISYSIGYITDDEPVLEGRFKGRLIFDYFDHIAFLIGKQQNHTWIDHPRALLDGLTIINLPVTTNTLAASKKRNVTWWKTVKAENGGTEFVPMDIAPVHDKSHCHGCGRCTCGNHSETRDEEIAKNQEMLLNGTDIKAVLDTALNLVIKRVDDYIASNPQNSISHFDVASFAPTLFASLTEGFKPEETDWLRQRVNTEIENKLRVRQPMIANLSREEVFSLFKYGMNFNLNNIPVSSNVFNSQLFKFEAAKRYNDGLVVVVFNDNSAGHFNS